MKIFEEPMINVTVLAVEDIITASDEEEGGIFASLGEDQTNWG